MRRLCRACLGLGKTPSLADCPTCKGCGWEFKEVKPLLRKRSAALQTGTVIQGGAWPFEGHEPQESYFDITRVERPDEPFSAVEPIATIRGRAVRTEDGNMEITVL